LQAGQLTPFLVRNWAADVDLAVLGSFLRTAPVICPTGRQTESRRPEPTAPSEAVATVARTCGVDPTKVQARI
jgi:hypothetical protein